MELLWLYILLGVLAAAAAGYLIARSRRPLPPAEDDAQLEDEEARRAGAPGEVPAELPPGEAAEPVPPEKALRPVPPTEAPSDNLFRRLVQGLAKTQGQLVDRLDSVIRGRKKIDEELYEELEAILVMADIGIKTSKGLLEGLRRRVDREELKDPAALREHLRSDILEVLSREDPAMREADGPPLVILVVGVNGTGKTTTIGKLASRYTAAGKKVLLAAGDTFRAAAIEQLEVWAKRAAADVVKNKEGSDPASVIFDALQAARARGADVVIADTAGRLHTKSSLMEELKKVRRVIDKAVPGAPHEVLLVLDATMGQNALVQAKVFHEGTQLTGLVLTKLDGTAKGGIVIAIVDSLGLPVKFIGVGEKIEDLQPFDPEQFVAALF